MHRAPRPACRILLIALFPLFALAQAPDVTPLLPATTASTEAVRKAITSGEISRAAALAESLGLPDRQLWRGILAILRNDPTTAIRTLRGGDHPKALGVAYYLARQYLLFRDQMAQAIRGDPGDFGPYYYLGRHYDSDLDDAEEAAGWFRRALERNPSYARARAYLGSCLERLGQLREAEEAYQASTTVPLSQVGMARLKLATGDKKEALAWVEKAVAAEPRDAIGQRLAARLYEELGRPRDAVRAMELAAQAASYDASTLYVLYRLHRSLGDEAKSAAALREFERLRAIYGSQPQ